MPTKTNFIYLCVGVVLACIIMQKFGPKPEPEIKIVEKVVEVEKKHTVKHKKVELFPDGRMVLTEDEVSAFLKEQRKAAQVLAKPPAPKHSILLIGELKKVTGAQYIYREEHLNAGVIYNENKGYLTGGVSF